MKRLKKTLHDFTESSQTIDLTEGNIRKVLFSFTIPIIIGNLFQQLYSMVDTAVVGRGVGANALAAVGTTAPVTQLLLGLMIGMTSGMSVVIAQHFGSGDEKKTKSAITMGIVLISVITVLVTVIGIVCSRALFVLINTPDNMIDGAVLYAVILFSGTAASAAYNYEAGILRAFGNSTIPLLFLIVTSLLNVVLDLLFVFSLDWGITGVAVATVLSQLISGVLCFVYMAKSFPQMRIGRSDWKWDGAVVSQHLRTGIPMAFFASLLAVSFLILQSALNSLGSADVAAYTAASKMDTLVYQIMAAFGTAISTFAAQNYGKGAMERVRKGVRKSIGITVFVCLGLTMFVFLFGRYFMLLFIGPEETDILASGITYMRITSMFYVILGANYVIRFTLVGVGKSAIPMMVGISEIATRAAVTYLLIYRIGFLGMTFASPACWFTSTLLCVLCYAPMMRRAAKTLAGRNTQ